MAFKEWIRRLQPVNLYLVLFFTSAFFVGSLIASHFTQALTLLVSAYHTLCNIIALVGCIASIKHTPRQNHSEQTSRSSSGLGDSSICVVSDGILGSDPSVSVKIKQLSTSDKRMKNTFGWARINILTMLICCVFLASFCFSLQVEALQTLVHIQHKDAVHKPLIILAMGALGILLNIFCYILIGGYTFYHGSSLQVRRNGEVIMTRNISVDSASPGEQQLKRRSTISEGGNNSVRIRAGRLQGVRGMARDVLGCVFVMLVSLLVYYSDPQVGKFVDPIVAIISSTLLFVFSYPYMKESGLILLQTIPNHINIDSLKKELLEAFPGIVNVHDLHIWQFTGDKIISTAHIIFLDPEVYSNIRHQVTAFFVETGITQVTIQPEFQKIEPVVEVKDCLIQCQGENCNQSQCCQINIPSEFDDDYRSEKPKLSFSHGMHKHLEKKEIIPALPPINLRRFTLKVLNNEGDKRDDSNIADVQQHAKSEPNPQVHCYEVTKNSNNTTCAIDVKDTITIIAEPKAPAIPQILIVRQQERRDHQRSESV